MATRSSSPTYGHPRHYDTRGPQAPDVSCAKCGWEDDPNTMVWDIMDDPPTPFCSTICRAEYQRDQEEEHDTKYSDI